MNMNKARKPASNLPVAAGEVIKSLDSAAQTVTLASGRVCRCKTSVQLSQFKPGDTVRLTFVESNGETLCSEMARVA
ncbi:hypothetical protein [Phaeovulum sp.]|uniref:hypothetical protein n=1 Tax=Phaeovulum sp. TaxID=2934796 RepID=UPI0027322245|nr:hypothetical protein [Phaeovulum sp.]MDP3862847.1 hypothetical protein [Phaeovulum sp.]MDZ4118492.1 hypothetical protein [Phaeovulum sp.]